MEGFLSCLVRDEINTEKDREIANHVLHMHQYTNPNSVEEEEDEEEDTTNTKIFVNPNEGIVCFFYY